MIRIVVLIFLFAGLHATATGATTPQKSGGNEDNKQQEQVEPLQQKPTTWPLPFTPSQQVGADSQVSFPTDI